MNYEWFWCASTGPARCITLVENVDRGGAYACEQAGVWGHYAFSYEFYQPKSCTHLALLWAHKFYKTSSSQIFNGLWLYNFVPHIFHLFLTLCFFRLELLWRSEKNRSKLQWQRAVSFKGYLWWTGYFLIKHRLLLKIHLVKSISHNMEVGCSLWMCECGAGDWTLHMVGKLSIMALSQADRGRS